MSNNYPSEARQVHLLRHGETQTKDIFRGRVDDPLSETGWTQMRNAVMGFDWEVIVTSPLGRCRGFAAELGSSRGIEVLVDESLSEYHFGDWDGQRFDTIMAQQGKSVDQFFADPFNFTPPNAERFDVFHQRVVSAWRGIVEARDEKKILVVTHGGVIMSILADLFGVQRVHGKIDVDYASMSQIVLGTEGAHHRLAFHGVRGEIK